MKHQSADDLAKKIEAILFSVGKKIEMAEIGKLVRVNDFKLLRRELQKIQHEYDQRNSPMMLVEEGTGWKLTVRERYLPLVRKIVADTELPKTVMETLAVIAWKYPILQSEVIGIRTNKAYDHIKELEKMGFLTKSKEGRTYRIKLSQKFFDYFDLRDRSDIQKVFKKVKDMPAAPLDPDAKTVGDLAVYESRKDEHKPAEQSIGNLEVYEAPRKEPEVVVKEQESAEEDVEQEESEIQAEEEMAVDMSPENDASLRSDEEQNSTKYDDKGEERTLSPELEEILHKRPKRKNDRTRAEVPPMQTDDEVSESDANPDKQA